MENVENFLICRANYFLKYDLNIALLLFFLQSKLLLMRFTRDIYLPLCQYFKLKERKISYRNGRDIIVTVQTYRIGK